MSAPSACAHRPEDVKKLIKEEAELYMYQQESNLSADRAAYDMLVQHLVGCRATTRAA
jgi:hypothetical protein